MHRLDYRTDNIHTSRHQSHEFSHQRISSRAKELRLMLVCDSHLNELSADTVGSHKQSDITLLSCVPLSDYRDCDTSLARDNTSGTSGESLFSSLGKPRPVANCCGSHRTPVAGVSVYSQGFYNSFNSVQNERFTRHTPSSCISVVLSPSHAK